MILRKLEQAEHGKTRKLWEDVFTEDTKAFLDYYYYIKTRDNRIFVIEEDKDIRSMIHLNPYRIRIGQSEFPSAYIVAVATEEPYRGRGFMGTLLRASLEELYGEKVPFTFLMPAAAAIYTPYDFRFIYEQDYGELEKKEGEERFYWKSYAGGKFLGEEGAGEILADFSDAGLWDAEEMASFFREYFAGQEQAGTVRDSSYYQTMILEQQSERGGVRLIRENGKLKGFYAYAREEGLEIREPLYLPGYDEAFLASVSELAGQNKKGGDEDMTGGCGIKISACPPEYALGKKPLIMARIVCLPEFLGALAAAENDEVDCSFAVIDPILTKNSRVWKLESRKGETQIHVRETEDSEGVLPVAELTELFFGSVQPEELRLREGVILSEHLTEELKKIVKLTACRFNEIV